MTWGAPGAQRRASLSLRRSIFPLLGPPPSFLFSPFQHPKSTTTMTDMYDGKKGEPFEGTLEPYPHNELGVEVSSSCGEAFIISSKTLPLGCRQGRAYALSVNDLVLDPWGLHTSFDRCTMLALLTYLSCFFSFVLLVCRHVHFPCFRHRPDLDHHATRSPP
jgi:hypothetical protein